MSNDFVLTTQPVPTLAPHDASNRFYWTGAQGSPSFNSNVGPSLGELGHVQDLNIDLVRIASAVLAADRSVSRSGRLSSWNERDISLQVPVSDPVKWESVLPELQQLLGFLTGDSWMLRFVHEAVPPEQLAGRPGGIERVVLFSGGADSAIGAALSAADLQGHGQHVLVSHYSATTLAPLQRSLGVQSEVLFPGVLADHIQIHHSRRRTAPNGKSYGRENSTRSRSLLFLSFGLAVASIESVPLWIPENGYASINPPLGSDRRGSLSTRTTHPAFLGGLSSILRSIGAHSDIINPFASLTKGEMFTKLATLVGREQASNYLGKTLSCSHTGARSFNIPPKFQCGVCFGCVLRRASFEAAGIADTSDYVVANGDKRVERWLARKSVESAMRDFLVNPVTELDLAVLRLPREISLADAADLCKRAMDELRVLDL